MFVLVFVNLTGAYLEIFKRGSGVYDTDVHFQVFVAQAPHPTKYAPLFAHAAHILHTKTTIFEKFFTKFYHTPMEFRL